MVYGLDKKVFGERDILATAGDTHLVPFIISTPPCVLRCFARIYSVAPWSLLRRSFVRRLSRPTCTRLSTSVSPLAFLILSNSCPTSISLDKALACGAAVQAAILFADTSEDQLLFDVALLSLRYVFSP